MFSVSTSNPYRGSTGQALLAYAIIVGLVGVIVLLAVPPIRAQIGSALCQVQQALDPSIQCVSNVNQPAVSTAAVSIGNGVNDYILRVDSIALTVEVGYSSLFEIISQLSNSDPAQCPPSAPFSNEQVIHRIVISGSSTGLTITEPSVQENFTYGTSGGISEILFGSGFNPNSAGYYDIKISAEVYCRGRRINQAVLTLKITVTEFGLTLDQLNLIKVASALVGLAAAIKIGTFFRLALTLRNQRTAYLARLKRLQHK